MNEALAILLSEQTLALARSLVAGAEPVKAYELCTKTAPILALQHPKVKAFAALLRTHIDQYFDDEAYKRRYSGYTNGVKTECRPFADENLLKLHRAMAARVTIDNQAKQKQGILRVLAIGSWDCTLEKAVLEDNDNVHLTLSEISSNGNDASLALKALFPDRVSFVGRFDTAESGCDEMFDVVMALEVIEHVTDDLLFLSNIRARMAQDAVFVLSTPNAEDWYEQKHLDDFDAAARGERENWYQHVRAYTAQTLNAALLQTGFLATIRVAQRCLVVVALASTKREPDIGSKVTETFTSLADFKPGETVYSHLTLQDDNKNPVYAINGVCFLPWFLRPTENR